MIRRAWRRRTWMCAVSALLAACRLHENTAASPPPHFTVSSSTTTFCSLASQVQITLQPANVLAITDDVFAVVTPTVQFRQGSSSFPATATWQPSTGTILVVANQNLPGGSYDVVITTSANAVVVLPAVIKVIVPPTLTSAVAATSCGGANSSAVTVIGSNFVGATVTVNGQSVVPTVNAAGTSFTVSMPSPGLAANASYPVSVDNGLGCRAQTTVAVAPATVPTVTRVSYGPQLTDANGAASDQLPTNSILTARLVGENLPPTAVVAIDGVTATAVTATAGVAANNGLDVTFAAGALTGTHAGELNITVDGCSNSLAGVGFSVVQAPMTIARTHPNALVSTEYQSYLDIDGDFAAANGTPVKFEIDTDPDPITSNWVELPYLVHLDQSNTAHRVLTLAAANGVTLQPGSAYDVRVTALPSGEFSQGFLQAALLVTNAPEVPRIVYKDRDSVATSGDTVHVYGCDLTATTAFSLVDGNGVATVLSGLVTSSVDSWVVNRFHCENSPASSLSGEAVLTLPSGMTPGVYRLRATTVNGTSSYIGDDLYPLVVYGSSPSLPVSWTAMGNLAVGRKEPATAVVYDATGRKYAYVVGGDNSTVTSLDPAKVGAAEDSYEFAPVDPNHQLVNVNASVFGAGQAFTLFSNDGSTTPIEMKKAYGSAVVADSTVLSLLGGTTGSSLTDQSAEIYQGRLVDPALRPVIDDVSIAASGVVAAGGHAYVVVASYPGSNSLASVLESYPSLAVPVSVTTANSRVSLTVSAWCLPGWIGASYSGVPTVQAYRYDASSAAPFYVDDLTSYAAVGSAITYAGTCAGSAPSLVAVGTIDDDSSAPDSSQVPELPGQIFDLVDANQGLADPNLSLPKVTYGGSAILLTEPNREIVFIGGVDNKDTSSSVESNSYDTVTVFPLADSGALQGFDPTPRYLPTGQFFSDAISVSSSSTETAYLAAGVAFVGRPNGNDVYSSVSYNLPTPLSTVAGSKSQSLSIFGPGSILAGTSWFLLGGGTSDTSADFQLTQTIVAETVSASTPSTESGFVSVASALPTPSAEMGIFHLPPYVYLTGGTICNGSSTACSKPDISGHLAPTPLIQAGIMSP